MAALSKQQNFAVNTNKSQIYIEDDTTPLSYNYKTDQWSTLDGYAGIGLYSVESGLNIGLARISGTAVDLQQPTSADVAEEAIITTGEATFSNGQRRIITGVRPLLTGADANVVIKYRDTLNPATVTNYLLYSEDFSNVAWTKGNATITTNQTTAPDGSTTADDYSGDGGGAVTLDQASQDLGSTGDDYVASFYIKYLDHAYVQIQNPNLTAYVKFNIQTGVIDGATYTAGKIITYGIETKANGWYRCWVVFSGAASSTPTVRLALITSDGSDYTGTNGVYVWGAQVDNASALTSYTQSEATAGNTTLSKSVESSINSRSGIAPFRVDSRYHRIQIRVSGGFTTILGADVEYYPTGEI